MKLKLLAVASSQTYQLLFVLSLNSCWHLLAGLLAPLEPFLTTRSVVRLSLSCWRAISWQVGPSQPLQCQFSKTPSWYILVQLKTLGLANHCYAYSLKYFDSSSEKGLPSISLHIIASCFSRQWIWICKNPRGKSEGSPLLQLLTKSDYKPNPPFYFWLHHRHIAHFLTCTSEITIASTQQQDKDLVNEMQCQTLYWTFFNAKYVSTRYGFLH